MIFLLPLLLLPREKEEHAESDHIIKRTMLNHIHECSRVDEGGLSEQKGLKVGDQIIEVNGVSFEQISHQEAVEVMKASRQLIVTVRVGF